MPATPFIPKNPNDLIRAADWNQIQIDGREEVRSHDHSGGDQGVQLGTAALADGAVTAEKIADGTITAEKLDPNLELGGGGGTPDDDSVTTAKIANGAVTTAKLAQPLGSLSCGSVEVENHRLRPVFDEVDLDWSWQIDGAPINLEQPTNEDLGTAFEIAVEDVNNNLDALSRRALLILSRSLDPSLSMANGAESVYEKTRTPSLESILQRAGVFEDQIAAALEAINTLWDAYQNKKTPYPGLLFAVATMPQEVIDSIQAAVQNPIYEVSPRALFAAALSVAPDYSQHLSSAMLRPLGTIHPESGYANPPVLQLDPVVGFSRAELEIELTATLRGSGYAGIGIGGLQTPPPLGAWASLGGSESWGQQVRMTRRIPVTGGELRQVRVWGIAMDYPNWSASVVLDDLKIRARTTGFTPNYAEKPEQSVNPNELDPDLANVSTTPIPVPAQSDNLLEEPLEPLP